MKKILVLILAAALVLTFAACGGGGGSASSDPNCGHYEATVLEMMGFTMDVAEVFPDGFSMDLQDGGKAKFNYDGKSYNMKWTLDGTTFHAEGGGAELDGTLAGGVMQLSDVMGSGLEITLVNAETAGGDAPAAPAAGDYSWWDGQWYGWRVIYEGAGGYEELVDNGYDVVANIKVDGDKGTVTIWDYDESEDEALVTAEVSFQSGLTDKGCMVSESGEAFYEPLSKGSWVVDPGDDMVSAVDDMICIEGTNVDSDSEQDWFTYMIFLRPWGVDWSDLETVDGSNFPYEDMVPFHHEDWYKGQL